MGRNFLWILLFRYRIQNSELCIRIFNIISDFNNSFFIIRHGTIDCSKTLGLVNAFLLPITCKSKWVLKSSAFEVLLKVWFSWSFEFHWNYKLALKNERENESALNSISNQTLEMRFITIRISEHFLLSLSLSKKKYFCWESKFYNLEQVLYSIINNKPKHISQNYNREKKVPKFEIFKLSFLMQLFPSV